MKTNGINMNKSGRSNRTGNFRNFAAMGYWKLHGLYQDVRTEGNDPEALDLIIFYLLRLGEQSKWYAKYNRELGI